MDKNLIFLGISFVAHMEVDYVLVQGKAFIGRLKFKERWEKPLRVGPYYYGVMRIYNVYMDTMKVADKKICYLDELIKSCLHNIAMWKWACDKLGLYVHSWV